MATAPPGLLATVRRRQQERGQGLLIDNKNFTRAVLRVLPCPEEEGLGAHYISFWSNALNKGCTALKTWGFDDPLLDALNGLRAKASKVERDALANNCRASHEYWFRVLDLADMGTTESPHLRIWRAKQVIGTKLEKFFSDAEDGCDFTHPEEGRPIVVKKEVKSKHETEWTVGFKDSGPISTDPKFVLAALKAGEALSVTEHFYKVNLETYSEMYEAVTGEPLPEATLQQDGLESVVWKDDAAGGGSERPSYRPTLAAAASAPKPKVKVSVPVPVVVAKVDKGATVEFDYEGGKVQGVVLGKDEEGLWEVQAKDGKVYGVAEDSLTIVAEEPAAEDTGEAGAESAQESEGTGESEQEPEGAGEGEGEQEPEPVEPTPVPAPKPKSKPSPVQAPVAKPKAGPKSVISKVSPPRPGVKVGVAASNKASSTIRERLRGSR